MCFLCEKLKEYQLSIMAVILAVGIVLAAPVGTKNISQRGIYMTGSAEETVMSDSATWTVTLNTKNKTLSGAYKTIQTQI
nr:hypothetical protein [Cyanobacteria bacterium RUI128]